MIFKGGEGFGLHPHENYEIFSYIVSGGLKHSDTMGNEEVVERGDVQFTSAGSGMMHAEFNASKKQSVHLLQIWVKPRVKNTEPTYDHKYAELCVTP